MAKYSLLDVVNSTLESMDSFRVSDIDDVLEAQQIASIAEDVYYEVINDSFSSHTKKNLIQLESLADSSRPNYLKLPENVTNIHQSKVRYNIQDGTAGSTTLKWKEIEHCHPQDFLDRIGGRSTNETNTQIVTDFSGIQYVVRNKTAPQYWTSFDDEYIVFDSFDSDVDSTLQQSKNICEASLQGTFTKSSTYEIDLPEWFHPNYVQLVKARSNEYLRGEPSISDLRKGTAGLIKARHKQRAGNRKFQKKRYGR